MVLIVHLTFIGNHGIFLPKKKIDFVFAFQLRGDTVNYVYNNFSTHANYYLYIGHKRAKKPGFSYFKRQKHI